MQQPVTRSGLWYIVPTLEEIGKGLRLKKVTIAGFRCFGPVPVQLRLAGRLTAVVGANASGKTALLQALSRLFGVSRAQRTLSRSDFHLPRGTDPDDRSERELNIDVLIEFPELLEETATPETIAPAFRHMLIDHPKGAPVCRVRLEGRWEDDGTVDGEVSQDLHWVDTLSSRPSEEQIHRVAASERGLIQLHYTPASRDAGAQIRATTGTLAARLLRSIEWSEDTQENVEDATGTLSDAFEGEAAIKAIGKALAQRWLGLHDDAVDTSPKLSLISRRFEEVVSRIAVIFHDSPDGVERGLEALSDGQQSLFYFALAAAVYDLERRVVAGQVEGFRVDELRIPALTIFALEEPENHLSPYYLARIISLVRSLVKDGRAQAILTSHAPAVLSRIHPSEVRYFRRNPATRTSRIRSVKRPTGSQESGKFVLGAMQAFPELYFARFVLLVEGDSERVVLPRLAQAMGFLIDPSFIAIVPLGGRHVQHFRRLLNELEIPFATLLDLDLGRKGGGFGRVKTVTRQLLDIGVSKNDLLKLDDGTLLSDDALDKMHTWQDLDCIENRLDSWIDGLNEHGVFFSSPLDFDLMMLAAFPEAYVALEPARGGPMLTEDKAAQVVLGADGSGLALYQGKFMSFAGCLPAYRYHFMTRSKPATHMAAMAHLKHDELAERLPKTITRLLEHITDNLRRD